MTNFFTKTHQTSNIIGESNETCYKPVGHIGIRITETDAIAEIVLIISAAVITKCKVTVSSDKIPPLNQIPEKIHNQFTYHIESESQFIKRINQFDRIRFCHADTITHEIHTITAKNNTYIEARPVSKIAKIELMRYMIEQTISHQTHRYGNIVDN